MTHTLKDIVMAINTNNRNKKSITKWNKKLFIKIDTSDYTIKVENGEAQLEKGRPQNPDVSLEMTTDVFERMVNKEITPFKAKLNGELKTSGSIIDILKVGDLWRSALDDLSKSVNLNKF